MSSTRKDAVFQYQNTSGAFKSEFTDKKVRGAQFDNGGLVHDTPLGANGLVMGEGVQTSHLYVTGTYAHHSIFKFDINNGEL